MAALKSARMFSLDAPRYKDLPIKPPLNWRAHSSALYYVWQAMPDIYAYIDTQNTIQDDLPLQFH